MLQAKLFAATGHRTNSLIPTATPHRSSQQMFLAFLREA